MGHRIVSLLLFVPLILADDEDGSTADLEFTCDTKKCTFTLEIPQSSVTFVDVPQLESEIEMLNGNLTALRINGEFVANQTEEFQEDFNEISDDAISTLSSMFELSDKLKQSSTSLLNQSGKKKNEAQSLSDALKCMVNGGLPETCYSPPTEPPSTLSPSTTIEGSGHEGSGEEGSGEEGSGEGSGNGGGEEPIINDGEIDLMSEMLLT